MRGISKSSNTMSGVVAAMVLSASTPSSAKITSAASVERWTTENSRMIGSSSDEQDAGGVLEHVEEGA